MQEIFSTRVSQRLTCKVLGQPRSTQRYCRGNSSDQDRLVQRILELSKDYGKCGYRRIMALLREEGWQINLKRMLRLWRREGLKVPARQPKRKRLWLNDGSCVRHRPEYKNHVWSYDFMMSRSHDDRSMKILILIDEYTKECLAIVVERRLNSEDVLATSQRDSRIYTGSFHYVTTVCINLNSNFKGGTNNGDRSWLQI